MRIPTLPPYKNMNTVYKLVANTYCFAGTDRDSDTGKIDILLSESREKLEEVMRYMNSSAYDEKLYEQDRIRKKVDWNERRALPKKFKHTFSFGEVELPYLYDDYYGDGSVSDYSVEAIPYLDPKTFI